MKATHFVALCFTAVVALPAVACSSGNPDSSGSPADESEVADPDGKADGTTKPAFGTYELSGSPASGSAALALLVLKSDHTVHGQYAPSCLTCTPGHFDGTYKFTKSTTTSRRYIRIELPSNDVIRYEYKLPSIGKLKLRKDTSSAWITMAESSDHWCAAASDCETQDIIHPMCVGDFKCEDSSCSYQCGICPIIDCAAPPEGCHYEGGVSSPCDKQTCGHLVCGECDPSECGPQLGMPNTLCPDGVNYSGPTGKCLKQPSGSCGWEVLSCPDTPADCRTTGCSSGQYCSFCWGSYACIPDGAVC